MRTRATSIENVFFVRNKKVEKKKNNVDDNGKEKLFHHCRKEDTSSSMIILREEFKRLSNCALETVNQTVLLYINNSLLSIFTFNCQSLRAHS